MLLGTLHANTLLLFREEHGSNGTMRLVIAAISWLRMLIVAIFFSFVLLYLSPIHFILVSMVFVGMICYVLQRKMGHVRL